MRSTSLTLQIYPVPHPTAEDSTGIYKLLSKPILVVSAKKLNHLQIQE